jgi:hypothetical protein
MNDKDFQLNRMQKLETDQKCLPRIVLLYEEFNYSVLIKRCMIYSHFFFSVLWIILVYMH